LSPGFRPLKVAFFVGSLSNGGAERVVSTVIAGLDRSRFSPELALVRDQISYPLAPDIPLRCLEREAGLWPTAKTVQTIAWLCRWLKENNPEVIISMFSHYNLRLGAALSLVRSPAAWIARIASHPHMNETGLSRHWAHRVYPKATLIAANSLGLVGGFREHHRNPPWPLILLPNPIDFTRLDHQSSALPGMPLPDSPLIIAAGRLCIEKRYDLMLKAFQLVAEQTTAHLLILGNGSLRVALEKLAQALGLMNRVTMCGYVANPHAFMARGTLFLLTSDFEGSPNALIEAQALGLPAVSTDCPYGPSEIVDDGKTGFLAPTGDVIALSNRMLRIIQDPQLASQLSDNARARTRSLYSPARVFSAWETAILQARATSQIGQWPVTRRAGHSGEHV
jgi:glycosyltransferase involved in cell wall biosynthesis